MHTEPKKFPALESFSLLGDAIPAPHAVEQDSETAWALFNELSASHDAGFAPTAPAPIHLRLQETAAHPVGMARAKAPMLQDVIELARRNNRVCPLPQFWQQLYELLPARGEQKAPPPISGMAWKTSSSMNKRICLRDQIEWAASQNVLGAVSAFLGALTEQQWHQIGD